MLAAPMSTTLSPLSEKGYFLPLKSRTPLPRSEEHTSELQSLRHLVCRLLLVVNHLHLHSFPTRRSSDLGAAAGDRRANSGCDVIAGELLRVAQIVDLSGALDARCADVHNAEPAEREGILLAVEVENAVAQIGRAHV